MSPWSTLTSHGADLLLADIAVPPVDGLELIRQALAAKPDLEAIAITGFSDRYQINDVVEAGASDLLVKPFQADELALRITLAQDRRRAIGKLQTQRGKLQQMNAAQIRVLQDELTALKGLAASRQEGASVARSHGDAS